MFTFKTWEKIMPSARFVTCIDGTLAPGDGLITKTVTAKHSFTEKNMETEETHIVQLRETGQTQEDANRSPPVSLGHGHFGVGRKIYRFGQPEPVCQTYIDIGSGTGGDIITRVLADGSVLQILCKTLGYVFLENGYHSILMKHSVIEDGVLVTKQEKVFNQDGHVPVLQMLYFKGHLVLVTEYGFVKLINATPGHRFGHQVERWDGHNMHNHYTQLRLIEGGRRIGVFYCEQYLDEQMELEISYVPEKLRNMSEILDVIDGRFAITSVPKGDIRAMQLALFGLPAGQSVKYTDTHFATDTIMVVNFRLQCCCAKSGTPPGHPGCMLLQTKHRDSYGLAYLPTNTVISLRSRPILAGKLNDTPEVDDTLLSGDGSVLAIAVKSNEACGIPTVNNQIVVINTATGKHEIAYSGSVGKSSKCAMPKLLYFEVGPNGAPSAIVFRLYSTLIRQPIFSARADAVAAKLYELADGRLPMEIMIQIARYM